MTTKLPWTEVSEPTREPQPPRVEPVRPRRGDIDPAVEIGRQFVGRVDERSRSHPVAVRPETMRRLERSVGPVQVNDPWDIVRRNEPPCDPARVALSAFQRSPDAVGLRGEIGSADYLPTGDEYVREAEERLRALFADSV